MKLNQWILVLRSRSTRYLPRGVSAGCWRRRSMMHGATWNIANRVQFSVGVGLDVGVIIFEDFFGSGIKQHAACRLIAHYHCPL